MRTASLAVGLVALGCGAAPKPAPAPKPATVSVAPPEKASEPEPPTPTGPVLLDNEGGRAAWLDPPTPVAGRKHWVYDTLLASGDRSSVVRTTVGQHFGFHEDVGVVGPLELPAQVKQVLFGPSDSMLVVTTDGKLFAAPSVTAAKSAAAFEARSAPANAVSWDSAGDYLITTDGKQVHLSRDGGKTWSVTKSAAWGTLRTVLVRFDGVMAAHGGPAKTPLLFLSRDDGKSWQRSSFQPERVSRSGAFIWSDVWSCRAVLSENGSTWSKGGEELLRHQTARSWTASFGTGPNPEGFLPGAHRSLSSPPPPKVPAAKERRTGRGCPPPPGLSKAKQAGILGLLGTVGDASAFGVLGSVESGELGGFGTIGIGGLGGIGYAGRGPSEPGFGSCQGAACLRPASEEPEKTRTRFELFRDARCSAAGTGRSCSEGFERAPHVAVIDDSTGKRRVAELPKSCTPMGLASAGGLGLVMCRAGGAITLHVADGSGVFKPEGAPPDPAMTKWPVSIASDGTLLFHETCVEKKPCRAALRRPAEPGSERATREVKLEGAVGYRVLTRGRVLAVVARDKLLNFVLAEPGKSDVVLARGITLEGDLVGVHVDDKGRIVVRERLDRTRSESFVVGVDGKRNPI